MSVASFTALTRDVDPKNQGLAGGTILKLLNGQSQKCEARTLEIFIEALGPNDHQREDIEKLLGVARQGEAAARQATMDLQAWRDAAQAARCDACLVDEFTAQMAGVHTAVGRWHDSSASGADTRDLELTAYVPRVHDDQLRQLVASAAGGDFHGLILLEGTSSTGKTRSLYEVVQFLGQGWRVLRPFDATELLRVHERRDELVKSSTVLWLNELQRFFGGPGKGLSARLLRDLTGGTRPVVVVGTLWPSKRPDRGDDQQAESAALFDQSDGLVRAISVASFSQAERDVAQQFVSADRRIQRALEDLDQVGFTQTLAGAGELRQLYQETEGFLTRDLLDAAGDARRLGHSRALSDKLLRAMTLALWRHRNGDRKPPMRWEQAIEHATKPLRGMQGVQALIPIIDDRSADSWQADSYNLADYLELHIQRRRIETPILDSQWDALAAYLPASSQVPSVLAAAADRRGRKKYAERLYRAAAETGNDASAIHKLASWLAAQPGRESEVEQVWTNAITAGYLHASSNLSWWLATQPGRESEVEGVWRAAVAAGHPNARSKLIEWLAMQPGREAEVEGVWREAAGGGEAGALGSLARWLAMQPGREAEVEGVWREAAGGGEAGALGSLARWLERQPGRDIDVEAVWRTAIASGDKDAVDDGLRMTL